MFPMKTRIGNLFSFPSRVCRRSCFMFLLVMVPCSGKLLGAERDFQDKDEPCNNRFEATWRLIQDVSPDPEKYRRDSPAYWVEMSFEVYRHFAPLAHGDKFDAWLKFFVNQFGRHSGEADLRWLLVAPEYTMPTRQGCGFSDDDVRNKIANTLSKHIVRRCIADKVFLERYCTAVLWSRLYIRTEGDLDTSAHVLRETMPNSVQADPLYWIWARRFVVALFVTSRQDLLADAVPDKLHSIFPAWHQWIDEALRRTQVRFTPVMTPPRWVLQRGGVPDLVLPQKPFPDIEGPCLSGHIFSSLPSPLDPGSVVWPERER